MADPTTYLTGIASRIRSDQAVYAAGSVDFVDKQNPFSANAKQALQSIKDQLPQVDKLTAKGKQCMAQRIDEVMSNIDEVAKPGFVGDARQQQILDRAVALGQSIDAMPGTSREVREGIACGVK